LPSGYGIGRRAGTRPQLRFGRSVALGCEPMDSEQLQKVERVDARLVWTHEALDFTPWLEQHIDELAERIGVELEITAREEPVGPFSADLLGRDVTTGSAMLIENQLNATDHSHLGQIITYAAGLDTRVMVWISTEIREEHRQAIDWLNDVTREEYNFFAVRIELLKVGDGYAPDFVIVASPNTWQKRLRSASAAAQSGSERGERYREIWGRFIEKLRAKDATATRARTGPTGNWFNTPGGLVVTFSREGPRVELYLDYGDAIRTKQVFDLLHEQRQAVEEAVGKPLSWERLDQRQASRVALYTDGSAELDGAELDALLDRLVDMLLLFRRVLPTFVAQAEQTSTAAATDADY
jgi:Domain of unknown function (DUF4268)